MITLVYMGKLGVGFLFMPFTFMSFIPVLVLIKKRCFATLAFILAKTIRVAVIEGANRFILKRALKKCSTGRLKHEVYKIIRNLWQTPNNEQAGL
ncbi:MAG: hypothetical protein J6V80_03995 [Clostridia bacterium]|nr:hypothetical protein [Clostridia bacterium]